eukprot:TRINITY_DN9004_c0_g1_i1.p1 TRINITY_DN9004_c0_g1~~TRINITY_DN9004_c0_g1_i1.p1  ORF type:complete len:147 (-),score=20.15 TRINITY_DN9004_c0_g1_i1:30-446(-)
MFEIFSLCQGIPYQELSNQQVVEKLTKEQYKLPKPPACPDAIYEIMLQCWDITPRLRPDFDSIYQQLSLLDSDHSQSRSQSQSHNHSSCPEETVAMLENQQMKTMERTKQLASNMNQTTCFIDSKNCVSGFSLSLIHI